ncbi:hypothetical protein H8959_005845 [Pygathrix nigripes]
MKDFNHSYHACGVIATIAFLIIFRIKQVAKGSQFDCAWRGVIARVVIHSQK